MASKQTAVLQAVEVNGNTYEVPVTMEGLVEAINEQAKLIAAAEGSAFEHSAIEGNFLVEARRRVKAEKKKGEKGWMKWLEDNYQYKRESAYRSISIAENFDLVRDADSRMEALRIIEAHKKAAIEAGTAAPHGNRRQIAAPASESPVTNGHVNDGREEYRAALAEELEDIIADVEGPRDSDLDDPEIAEILREVEEALTSPVSPVALVEVVPPVLEEIASPEPSQPLPEASQLYTELFKFTGSQQQVELRNFQATLDRFEVELGPVTLNRAANIELTGLTVLLTDIQIRLDSLLDRVNKVVEDRKLRTDLKSARQEGLL